MKLGLAIGSAYRFCAAPAKFVVFERKNCPKQFNRWLVSFLDFADVSAFAIGSKVVNRNPKKRKSNGLHHLHRSSRRKDFHQRRQTQRPE
jgi:hypothetical protein